MEYQNNLEIIKILEFMYNDYVIHKFDKSSKFPSTIIFYCEGNIKYGLTRSIFESNTVSYRYYKETNDICDTSSTLDFWWSTNTSNVSSLEPLLYVMITGASVDYSGKISSIDMIKTIYNPELKNMIDDSKEMDELQFVLTHGKDITNLRSKISDELIQLFDKGKYNV